MWPLKGNLPCPSPGSLNPQRTHRWRVNLKISRVLKPLPRNITIQAEMWSYSRVFHLIKRNHWKQANAKAFLNGSPSRASVHFLGHAYLKPLPVGLHLEDDTGVRFGKRISVRNAFACHTQLNFGQAGAVKDSQCISSWLVNVAHLLHSVLGRKRGKKETHQSPWYLSEEKAFQSPSRILFNKQFQILHVFLISLSTPVAQCPWNKQTKPKKQQETPTGTGVLG